MKIQTKKKHNKKLLWLMKISTKATKLIIILIHLIRRTKYGAGAAKWKKAASLSF